MLLGNEHGEVLKLDLNKFILTECKSLSDFPIRAIDFHTNIIIGSDEGKIQILDKNLNHCKTYVDH